MAKVKVFATDKHTDRTKTRCPRFSFQGHKNVDLIVKSGYKNVQETYHQW